MKFDYDGSAILDDLELVGESGGGGFMQGIR
jgi:hypothetical protein